MQDCKSLIIPFITNRHFIHKYLNIDYNPGTIKSRCIIKQPGRIYNRFIMVCFFIKIIEGFFSSFSTFPLSSRIKNKLHEKQTRWLPFPFSSPLLF